MPELYDFTIKDIDGEDYSFEQLRNKVVLLVNTASKCGFTTQYEGLQKLYEEYGSKGLEIIGFPSNDFLFQDPGTNEEIKSFCLLNFGVSFTLSEKVKVRGKNTSPVFEFLVAGGGSESFKGPIKWNFTKFLFDKEGRIVDRFEPKTKPEEIESAIKNLL